jgi:hypothetical protein
VVVRTKIKRIPRPFWVADFLYDNSFFFICDGGRCSEEDEEKQREAYHLTEYEDKLELMRLLDLKSFLSITKAVAKQRRVTRPPYIDYLLPMTVRTRLRVRGIL